MQHGITRYVLKLGPLCAVAVALSACSDAGQSTTRPDLRPSVRQGATPGQWTFTAVDVQGATNTTPMDINSSGDIVGRFVSGGQTYGFLRSADGDFTTIKYPGASFTVAAGINSEGDIVGWYAQLAIPTPLTRRHGFLLSKGEFTSFDPLDSKFTNPLGINAHGDIVGRFCSALPCGPPGSGANHGFLWQNGESTTIDVSGSAETSAWKISPEGLIVGAFRVGAGPNRLFTLRGSDTSTFDLPGALPLTQTDGGVNARGDIVSHYCDASPCGSLAPGTHGFLLQQGQLTKIDFPLAKGTGTFAINARGDIVGAYIDASGGFRGFVLTGTGR